MKKTVAVLFILACLGATAGCTSTQEGAPSTATPSHAVDATQPQTQADPAEGQENSEAGVEPEVEQATGFSQEEQMEIYYQYVAEYHVTGMLYDHWENPEELDVNRLINFYYYNASFQKYVDDLDWDYSVEFIGIPASEVIGQITNRFDVSEAYLKTAENYDSETDTFIFSTHTGFGSGESPELVNIIRNGDSMTLCYVWAGEDWEDETKIDLTLRLDGDNFKYTSCIVS